MKYMLRNFLSDKEVKDAYIEAGAHFGDAVSYIYLGECIGFEVLLDRWEKWEKEYAKRGYRTISIDDFVEIGGYGKETAHLEGIQRKSDEEPIFHAEIYRQKYLGKTKPVINLEKMMKEGKQQSGSYSFPSTKNQEGK